MYNTNSGEHNECNDFEFNWGGLQWPLVPWPQWILKSVPRPPLLLSGSKSELDSRHGFKNKKDENVKDSTRKTWWYFKQKKKTWSFFIKHKIKLIKTRINSFLDKLLNKSIVLSQSQSNEPFVNIASHQITSNQFYQAFAYEDSKLDASIAKWHLKSKNKENQVTIFTITTKKHTHP